MKRSSRPEVFCEKGFLRNFTKFTGKHLSQSLFFNKVAGLRTETLLKKRLWHRCFPVNFARSSRTPFLQNIFGRLLQQLKYVIYKIKIATIKSKKESAHLIGIMLKTNFPIQNRPSSSCSKTFFIS